ncbi:glycosyltransferase family 61 protein, partial [Escherichia coli]|uniref:glycosyltransferase 61 family protein n=1 Tax=Escherichia coli TaxID=562 RepID=UPI0019321B98
TIIPEEMTLYQQIAAFANAKVVVGNLGGSFSNIVFSPNKLSVVALTTEFMHDDFFFDITSNKKGYYTSIHGKATDPTAGMQSDFTIDADFVIERVRRELDRHGLS